MRKVILITSFLVTLSFESAVARESDCCSKPFEGFHLGTNIGYGVGYAKQTVPIEDLPFSTLINNKGGLNGIDGGIGTGYTTAFNNWRFGVTFDANWASTQGKLKSKDPIVLQACLKNSLQLYGKTGYVIGGKTMPFIGLGWDNSAWDQFLLIINESFSKTKRHNALLWKAGVDFLTTDNIILGFEYVGTLADSKQHTGQLQGRTVTMKLRPQYNRIALTAKILPFADPCTDKCSKPCQIAGCPRPFQGLYLGSNIGYGDGYGRQTLFTNDQFAERNKLAVIGVDGGIGTGYTLGCGNWRYGLSFDANWSNSHGKLVTQDGESIEKAHLKNSLQLYGRMGYVLSGMTMPFIGLGWDNSAWRQSFARTGSSLAKTRRYNALLWKAGVDFLATKYVVFGFEYMGTVSGSKKQSGFVAGAGETTLRLKPQYNKFALTAKIVYNDS